MWRGSVEMWKWHSLALAPAFVATDTCGATSTSASSPNYAKEERESRVGIAMIFQHFLRVFRA